MKTEMEKIDEAIKNAKTPKYYAVYNVSCNKNLTKRMDGQKRKPYLLFCRNLDDGTDFVKEFDTVDKTINFLNTIEEMFEI